MNSAEYRTMYEVEDIHWWYKALRSLLIVHWTRYNRIHDPVALDIGCGTGANMVALSAHASVSGLDLSREALHFSQSREIAKLVLGVAQHLPYRSECFDGIIMMDVLYHRAVNDKPAALQEAVRVLKPDGILIVNVPAYPWLYSSHDEAIHTDKRFTKKELAALLEGAGLKVERVTYWNTLLFLPAALVRVVREKTSASGDSDLQGYKPSPITSVFDFLLVLERFLLKITNLPFGLSVFAVARKVD